MPSNKQLTTDILAFDANASLEGMNNDDLAARLKKLRTEATEVVPEVAKAMPAGHTVAEGRAITSKRGMLEAGDEVSASVLGGGADALEALVKSGYIVAPK